MNEHDEMVTVASGSSVQADQMKMYLEGLGIPVFLHGEFSGTVAPHLASPGGACAVRVTLMGAALAAPRVLPASASMWRPMGPFP